MAAESEIIDVYVVPKENKDILFGDSSTTTEVVSEIETMTSPKDLEVPIMKQRTFLIGGPNGVLEVLRLVKRTTGDLRLPNIRQNMIVYADQYVSFNMKNFTKLKKDGVNIAIPVRRGEDKKLLEAVESLKVLHSSLQAIQNIKEFLVLNLKDSKGGDIVVRRPNEIDIKNKLTMEDPRKKKSMRIIFVLKNPWAGTSTSMSDMKISGMLKFDKSYEENVSLFSSPKVKKDDDDVNKPVPVQVTQSV
jgi:hypothetical protein